MKRGILKSCLFAAISLLSLAASAQSATLPDQNPNYWVSQEKYTNSNYDSLIALQGTTVQQTYKAIDYLADKREAKERRKTFRRELRLERARYGGYYGYNDYMPYFNYNVGYNNGYYGNYRPYYGSSNWSNFAWSALPLAVTLGMICR